jgi:HEAT repeat protein
MLDEPEAQRSAKLRRKIAFALHQTRSPTSAPRLRSLAMRDSDARVRLLALAALSSMRDRGSVSVFVQALTDPNPNVRIHAVDGLRNAGLPEVVPPLIGVLRDPHGTVRTSAARALAALGDPAALEPLRKAVSGAWRPDLRIRLRAALRRLESQLGA